MIAWVGLFVGVAAIVIVRTTRGWKVRDDLDQLHRELQIVASQRDALETELATARSRPVLGPRVRALGLRDANASELRELPIGPRR